MSESTFSSAGVEVRSLAVSDGTRMVTHIARPPGHSSPPGIVILQEAYGVNEYLREVVAQFATLGFAAAAPSCTTATVTASPAHTATVLPLADTSGPPLLKGKSRTLQLPATGWSVSPASLRSAWPLSATAWAAARRF
jgi:dienelactone hydrolase